MAARLRFYNTGPDQLPGLLVMALSDEVAGLPDLDPNHEQIVVLVNANDEAQTLTEPTLAGATLHLHPVLAGSVDGIVKEASFDSQTGAFSVPARTTVVFVDGQPGGPATITIQMDAQPDNPRNFRFDGDLGEFKLDDEGIKNRDTISHTHTFTVAPGVYTVHEQAPYFWHLTEVACDPVAQAAVDLSAATVTLTVAAGDHITCTFVNQFAATLWVRKYLDRNGSGVREGEPGLKGWQITVYDVDGATVVSKTTNGAGKAHFWNLRPGHYTVCETQQEGWFNSQPSTLDPGFGNQPCYRLETAPAQLWQLYFGNHDKPGLVGAAEVNLAFDVAATTWVMEADDEHYADDGWFVDTDVENPETVEQLYLPLVGR